MAKNNNKITPRQINEVTRLVDNTLDGIKNGMKYLRRFSHEINNVHYLLNLLEREKNRLSEQLEIFNDTDVEKLKDMVYDKDFNNLIQNKLYGYNVPKNDVEE